ncbi:MAG: ion transporter [Halomonas sp.]|nr:ion transporter [Halomonas sp.]MDM7481535.1 ion transporter [Halomonas sp.]
MEAIFVAMFMVEYLLRFYAVGEDPRYRGVTGRVRYVFSFWALVDLLAIVPYFLGFMAHNICILGQRCGLSDVGP